MELPIEKLDEIRAIAKLILDRPNDKPALLVFIKPDLKSIEFVELCSCANCHLNNNKIIGLINSGKMKLKFDSGN